MISPCHTGWPDPTHIRVIQVGQCSWPIICQCHTVLAGSDTYSCHTGWPMQSAQISSPCHTGWPDPMPIRAHTGRQCSWPKSFHRPYRLAGSDTYSCIPVGQCSWPKSVLRAIQVAGSDTYPCHTGRPMQLAQIISPCHTGWPDPMPIRAILVANAVRPNHSSVPYRLAQIIQVGRIRLLRRWGDVLVSTYCHLTDVIVI